MSYEIKDVNNLSKKEIIILLLYVFIVLLTPEILRAFHPNHFFVKYFYSGWKLPVYIFFAVFGPAILGFIIDFWKNDLDNFKKKNRNNDNKSNEKEN